jgi:hypothetical protein
MPKYARNSAIDLDDTYGAFLDIHAPMRRNIRTKTDMNRTHHCEDKECGGAAPKARCIVKLHFAFCLAPVVDMDVESKTYGKVVIHGERFAVISPTGCAEHPYRAEYNLDLKDARNDRANYEIRWKKIFEDFKAEHEATLKREAEQMRVMEKMMGMTGHQRQTMLARQDNMEYQQRRHLELANRAAVILNNKEDEAGGLSENEALQPSSAADPGTAVAVARPPPDPKWGIQDELAQSIGSVTSEDLRSVIGPRWLHDELFVCVDNRRAKITEPRDSSVVVYRSSRGIELPAPTFMWLMGELFPDIEESVEVVEAAVSQAVAIVPEGVGVTRVTGAAAVSRMRRKENKLVKKQRAAKSRALARTLADEMETQEAEEKELEQSWKTGKSRTKKSLGRTKLTRFA